MHICQKCGAKCCRYVALEIDKPKKKSDFQNIRWYVAHSGVWVYVDDGEWHLAFDAVCDHLDENNRCTIYDERPDICRQYSGDTCEGTGDLSHQHEFHTVEEVEEYLKTRKKKKKKRRKKKRS